MSFEIAIQPDNYGPGDSSSPRWSSALKEAGHKVRQVNVYAADILDQLKGCDGFMWRHGHLPHMRQIAKRLLPVIENELGLCVYPDQNTCWHYDDKLAQNYLFQTLGIPTPKTWVWFEKEAALEWASSATYPLVLKLWSGASSKNVRLVHSFLEAKHWIEFLFGQGVTGLEKKNFSFFRRCARAARFVVTGDIPQLPSEVHKNYVYFQEFLPGNKFDTRVTVIGDRAFAYRRFNRPNDFRASGSGNFDTNFREISRSFIELGFEVSHKLKAQSIAIDGLWQYKKPVVGEVSYTFVSWVVQKCPGFWDEKLNWHEGHMWPEEAQVADFLVRLKTTRIT